MSPIINNNPNLTKYSHAISRGTLMTTGVLFLTFTWAILQYARPPFNLSPVTSWKWVLPNSWSPYMQIVYYLFCAFSIVAFVICMLGTFRPLWITPLWNKVNRNKYVNYFFTIIYFYANYLVLVTSLVSALSGIMKQSIIWANVVAFSGLIALIVMALVMINSTSNYEIDKNQENNIYLSMCKCLLCGHEWFPRKPSVPKVCPKCHSTLWNSHE